MNSWFRRNGDDAHERELRKALSYRRQAEEDHEEVKKLLKELEIEHKKNHYAELVESALGARKAKE